MLAVLVDHQDLEGARVNDPLLHPVLQGTILRSPIQKPDICCTRICLQFSWRADHHLRINLILPTSTIMKPQAIAQQIHSSRSLATNESIRNTSRCLTPLYLGHESKGARGTASRSNAFAASTVGLPVVGAIPSSPFAASCTHDCDSSVTATCWRGRDMRPAKTGELGGICQCHIAIIVLAYAQHTDAASIRFADSGCTSVFKAGCRQNKSCSLEFWTRQSIDGHAQCQGH